MGWANHGSPMAPLSPPAPSQHPPPLLATGNHGKCWGNNGKPPTETRGAQGTCKTSATQLCTSDRLIGRLHVRPGWPTCVQTPRASHGTTFQPSCHLQLKQPVPQGICLFSSFCWTRFSGSTLYESRFYFSLHPM